MMNKGTLSTVPVQATYGLQITKGAAATTVGKRPLPSRVIPRTNPFSSGRDELEEDDVDDNEQESRDIARVNKALYSRPQVAKKVSEEEVEEYDFDGTYEQFKPSASKLIFAIRLTA